MRQVKYMGYPTLNQKNQVSSMMVLYLFLLYFTVGNIDFFVDYTQLLYELISCVVRGQIGHDEVIQLLGEIVVCH